MSSPTPPRRAAPTAPARLPRRTLPAIALAAAFALALGAPPTTAAAQAPALDQIDVMIAAGDFDGARAAIQGWWVARGTTDVPGAERARALMLRARLAADPAASEEDYLSIVLGYPLAPEAPQALLRLGQGLLATGEALRAAGYLQRLVADYPGRHERATGLLWLARARHAARQHAGACTAVRDGLRDIPDPDLLDLFRAEEATVCADDAATRAAAEPQPADQPPARPTPADPAPTRPAPTQRPPSQPAPPPAEAAGGRFAVQIGAYRQQESIDDAVARLRRAGHEPRVVTVPGSQLIRVRVGRFTSAQEADRFLGRIRSAGFDAIVVTDADRERRP
jgi:cell division septation protein DedD